MRCNATSLENFSFFTLLIEDAYGDMGQDIIYDYTQDIIVGSTN